MRRLKRESIVQGQTETILLFGTTEAETILVKRLVSSFEIEVVLLTIGTVRKFVTDHPEKKICLVIFHVEEEKIRQAKVISLIRDFVGPLVPFLVLIPEISQKELQKLLKSGADDFIELPLDENRFSISFLILLEMGQTITKPSLADPMERKSNEPSSGRELFTRLIGYFREGLNYFAPKSLTARTRTEKFSDRWHPVKRLGIGGFGVVWLVQELGSRRLAVAKTPHSSQMNIRVLRSAAILKRLVHHPNIVHLLELVKDEGKFILIQEYVKGPTLQQLLEKSLTPLEKESYFLQLLSVISYAHKHKILHRDLKPENIIISPGGQLKLLDFGIARDLSWQGPDRSSEGTVNFMPPEQFVGQSCLASDVWALGVILFIFATGAVPYFQQNDQYPADIDTTMNSRAPHTIRPEIDPQLERIIMTCLQTDLNKRYQDATDLLGDLQTSLEQFGRGKLL